MAVVCLPSCLGVCFSYSASTLNALEINTMPRVPPPRPPPRKSNTSTPGPNEDGPPLADRLNFADTPRPFKNPHFVSKLSQRTASSTTTQVRKNVKQILILERERLSGGDGFLSASQTRQKLRGLPIDPAGKKKATGTGHTTKKRGNINNLRKGRLSNLAGGSGTVTPSTVMDGEESVVDSRRTTPVDDEDEDVVGGSTGLVGDGFDDITPKGEVITYHTPTAPPSLLPAKKYCDITGLHAAYTDPRTKLRYKGLDVWHVVRGLGPGSDQAYLSLRGAQTSLK